MHVNFGPLGRNWVRCNTSDWCRQAGDLLDDATAYSVNELLDTRDGVTALSGFDHNDVYVFSGRAVSSLNLSTPLT